MEKPAPQPEAPKQPENRQTQSEVLPDAPAITKKLLFQQPFEYSADGKIKPETFINVPIQLTVLSIRKIGEFGTYYEVGVNKDQKLGWVSISEVKDRSVPWNTRLCLIPQPGKTEFLVDTDITQLEKNSPRRKIALPPNAELYFPILETVVKDGKKFFRIGMPLGNSTLTEGFPCWIQDKTPDKKTQSRVGILADKTKLKDALISIKFLHEQLKEFADPNNRSDRMKHCLHYLQKKVASLIAGNYVYDPKKMGTNGSLSNILVMTAQDLHEFTTGDYKNWLGKIEETITPMDNHLSLFDKNTADERWNAVKGIYPEGDRSNTSLQHLFRLDGIKIRTDPQKEPQAMRFIPTAELP